MMSFNPQQTQTKQFDYQLIEEGTYPARLARITELGVQSDMYAPDGKPRVVFSFTLPTLSVDVDGEAKQQMINTFPMNKSNNPDATVMKWAKALNSNATSWEDIIGKPCMVQVDNYKNKEGELRHKISNVIKPMAGIEIAEPDCDSYVFDFDDPDMEVWAKLSEFRQNQIKQALNFEGSKLASMVV